MPDIGLARLAPAVRGDLGRYLLTGGLGFCIDGGILQLLTGLGWTPLGARAIGFPLAVTATWWLNRVWSFRSGRRASAGRQYVSYLLVQAVGLAINFSVFALLVATSDWLHAVPLVPLAIGAGLAMIATYLLSRYMVFAG